MFKTLKEATAAASKRQANNATFQEAQFGMPDGKTMSGKAQLLANVAAKLHLNDKQTTQCVTAVAYRKVGAQGVFIVARNAALTDRDLAKRFNLALSATIDAGFIVENDQSEWEVLNANNASANRGEEIGEGMHAEMMIVRELYSSGITREEIGKTVHIGASSTCCKDCSGWMSKYKIAHAPIHDQATASKQWRHPITYAAYQYSEGDVSYYHRDGKSLSPY
jgi:hypothetical protein